MSFIEKKHTYKIIFFVLLALLFVIMLISATMGSADISFTESMKIVISRIPGIGKYIDLTQISSNKIGIVTIIRMPRIILAGLIGMNLAIAGSALQGMLRNPMADPGIIGISSGAGLGAALAITVGAGSYYKGIGLTTISAFIGAAVVIFLVYNIAKTGNKIPVITLILAGIAVSFICSALTQLLMIFNRDQIEMIVRWTMGSLSAANWTKVKVILPISIFGISIIMYYAKELNVISTGEETAKTLGVNTEKTKKILLIVCSLITAACVSVSGVIGFVGLVIPHIMRILTGADQRVLLPYSAIGGAIFMIICDTLARTIAAPAEIPVGIITSLFGAPFFVYLLIINKRKGGAIN